MRKLMFILSLCLLSSLAWGQSMRVNMKNGMIVHFPIEEVQGTSCATSSNNTIDLSSYESEIKEADKITLSTDEMYKNEGKFRAYVPVKSFAESGMTCENRMVIITNPANAASYYAPADENGYATTYYGTSSGISAILNSSPYYQTLTVRLEEVWSNGNVTVDVTDSTVLQARRTDKGVDKEYYLVGDYNNWTISDDCKFSYPTDNLYDGNAFSLKITPLAGKTNNFYIVPASAVKGNTYDESKALGIYSGSTMTKDFYGKYSYGLTDAEKSPIAIDVPEDAIRMVFSAIIPEGHGYAEIQTASSTYENCYTYLGHSNMNKDPNGYCDIEESFGSITNMIRQLVNHNDISADVALCPWGDTGISEFDFGKFSSGNPMTYGLYLRLQKGVEYCNTYLELGLDDAQKNAEIHALRAYYNLQLFDLFRHYPYFENTLAPSHPSIEVIYSNIESDLLNSVDALSTPKAYTSVDANYGRVNKAVAWMLLARLYLNSEVYIGQAKWSEAKEYAMKVINSGAYSLSSTVTNGYTGYQKLFMGDNGESDAAKEAILPVFYDGKTAASWGGTMFLIAATHDGNMGDHGTTDSWAGIYMLPGLINKFGLDKDDRKLFMSDVPSDISDYSWFCENNATTKFTNLYSDGSTPHDNQFVDADFFLIRLAEAYLTVAEADLRLGDADDAATYINNVRTRAHAATQSSYTLDDMCDEWGREFYLEGRRRTDLVRFGNFAGDTDYTWQWKGGLMYGTNVDEHYNIFPIPTSVISSDNKATQNPGY